MTEGLITVQAWDRRSISPSDSLASKWVCGMVSLPPVIMCAQ